MSTALTLSPGTSVISDVHELAKVTRPDSLIPADLKLQVDKLVEQADVCELIGSPQAEALANGVKKKLQAFIKEHEDGFKVEVAPYKASIVVLTAKKDMLLAPIHREKDRLVALLSDYGAEQARQREAAKKAAEDEAKRIREEAAEIERKRVELEQETARKAKEAEERLEREKREREQEAERQRQDEAYKAATLKAEREKAEREGTAAEMKKARAAEAAAAKKREDEEAARVKAEKDAANKAAADKLKQEQEAKQKADALKLQQATLISDATEASKNIGSAKAAVSGSFQWRIEAEDMTNEGTMRACMERAFTVRPDLFTIAPKIAVIKAELKMNEKLEVSGLRFQKEWIVR